MFSFSIKMHAAPNKSILSALKIEAVLGGSLYQEPSCDNQISSKDSIEWFDVIKGLELKLNISTKFIDILKKPSFPHYVSIKPQKNFQNGKLSLTRSEKSK